MDPITMGAVAFGTKLVDNAIQYYTNKNSQKQAQANTRKNMAEQADLEDSSWYNRIARSTQALKSAGLSPALMTGQAQGAAAVSHSESMPQVSAPSSGADLLNTMMLSASQRDLNESAAEKNRADAQLVKQEISNKQQDIKESESRVELNSQQQSMLVDLSQKYQTESLILGTEYSRMLSEDSVAHHALMDYCNRRIAAPDLTESERDFWTAFRAIGSRGKFNAGSLMAMRLFSEAWNSVEEYERDVAARAILKQVQDMQLKDEGIIDVLANMPVYQAKLVFGQTAEALQNAEFRRAYRTDLIPSEKDKLDEDVRVQKHNDPAGMLKDGDYTGFGVFTLGNLLRFGGTLLAARQFGRGGSLPAGKPNAPSASLSGTVQKKGLDSNGRPALSDKAAESWSRIQSLKYSDPAAYSKAVKEWQERYGKK